MIGWGKFFCSTLHCTSSFIVLSVFGRGFTLNKKTIIVIRSKLHEQLCRNYIFNSGWFLIGHAHELHNIQ